MQRLTGFTVRQLVTILGVLLTAAFLAPVAASAAGQLVTIVDNDGTQVEVSEGEHRLLVDALPGVSDPWHLEAAPRFFFGDENKRLFLTQFSFKDKVAITSITGLVATGNTPRLSVFVYAANRCTGLNQFDALDFEVVHSAGTLHMTYPQPLVVSAPNKPGETTPWFLCVDVGGDGDQAAMVQAVGYRIVSFT